MNRACRVFVSVLVLFALTNVRSCPAQSGEGRVGPFGFFYGETKAEVLGQVGRSAVQKEKPDWLKVTTAPKPHAAFEAYSLFFSPTKGLLKIIAIGKDIDNDAYGSDVRSNYGRLKEALDRQYGEPKKEFDFLKSGSIWDDPKDFMMALFKKERTLSCYWQTNVNHVNLVALDARALNSSTGYLELDYEFEGWEAYVDQHEAKDDAVL